MTITDIVERLFDTIFYTQQRVGLNEEMFKMYKIRTMERGREQEYAELLRTHGADKLGRLINDPRITHIGKYLRKYYIDELPQILNVAKGDMALTGPRPLIQEDYDKLPENLKELRKKIKPGFIPIHLVIDYFDIKTREDLLKSEERYLELRINKHKSPYSAYKVFSNILNIYKEISNS